MNRRSISLIRDTLGSEELRAKPPVLVDVGASGALNRGWAVLAPYSICIAFDPDEPDFDHEGTASGYHKSLKINALVGSIDSEREQVYLTRSPYCSSTLRPRSDRLASYAQADLFEVINTGHARSVKLSSALRSLNLDYVDWLKTDSQGIDLRIFKSLTDEQQKRVIIVQLEPGIVDGYDQEDKLADILKDFSNRQFWCAALDTKGPVRGSAQMLAKYLTVDQIRALPLSELACGGWAEVEYINSFEDKALRNSRDFLLGWIIATIRGHHAFALELAHTATAIFPNDKRFLRLLNESLSGIQSRYRTGLIRRGFAKICRLLMPRT
jgi:hypothetical protein